MENKFYSIFTNIGKAKLANSAALGQKLNISTIKIGDGGDDNGAETAPKEGDKDIVRERWEGSINGLNKHPKNDKWLVTETVIPDEIGNFYITEFGLYDEEGDLIVIGKYPKTYKPTLDEGSGTSSYIKVILEVANTEVVQLKVDPAVVLASREYVDQQLGIHKQTINPHPQYALQIEHLSNLPFYPEIINKDHRLSIKKVSNKVVVMPNQVIRWRGWKDFNTSDYPLEQRSFSLEIDGLYHIRWNVEKGIYVTKVSSYYDMVVRTYDDICIALFDKGDIYRIHQANKISFKYSIKTWDDTVYSIPFNPFAKINYEIISDKGSAGAIIVNAKGAYSFRPYFAKNPEEAVQFEKSKNYVFLDSSDNLDNEVIYTKGSIILRDNEIIVSAQSAEPGVLIEENIANAEYLFIAGNIPLDKNYFITGINVSRSGNTMPTTGTLVGDLIYHDDYQMNNI